MYLQKTLVVFLLIFTFANSAAQNPARCNCRENLDTLVRRTELDYAGFPAKVNPRNRRQYDVLVDRLSGLATRSSTTVTCYRLMEEYVHFFRDKHFILSLTGYVEQKQVPATANKAAVNPAPPFAGTWLDADSSIKLEVSRTGPLSFVARVAWARDAKTMPAGMVYSLFRKKGDGWISERYDWFTSTHIPVSVTGNLLREWNLRVFGRIGATTIAEQAELMTWRDHANGLAFYMADAKTSCLRIPSFIDDDQVAALVARNDSAIRSHPGLIIDLRGNGGGNTGWRYVLPYLMTNEIRQPDNELRISDNNRARAISDFAPLINGPLPDEYKKYFPDSIMALYKASFEKLKTTTDSFLVTPSVYFPFDSASRWPQEVALLFDEGCGSSTEYFFEISKQSRKVTRYGVHTLGMMDYVGMNHPTPLPAKEFTVSMPMARSGWTSIRPIDDTGFIPENSLGDIPREDWIRTICENWR
ncbi:MAG: hypothetical protein EOO09_08725 [Chitinophagaceae bacterium]|nr:MAG: hypothetical protein EOO09_08725 [Chitinophagaceae bacterium]